MEVLWPRLLMMTGYEQVRSIIAGDRKVAERVELVLPETGVWSPSSLTASIESTGCCGGPVPAGS